MVKAFNAEAQILPNDLLFERKRDRSVFTPLIIFNDNELQEIIWRKLH